MSPPAVPQNSYFCRKIKVMGERHCRECGALITGRADKKFCSDMCRTSFHNREYRRKKKEMAEVNAILSANRRILEKLLEKGITELPLSDPGMQNFCAGLYTSSEQKGKRTIYHCYEYSYMIKRRGLTYFCYICASEPTQKD